MKIVVETLTLIKEKRDSKIKGHACPNSSRQKGFLKQDDIQLYLKQFLLKACLVAL